MKPNQKHVTGQQEIVREAEEQLRKELTSFRNTVAFALIFINVCFFVFAVTLKAYANELPGYKLFIPVSILVSLFNSLIKVDYNNVKSFGDSDNFKDWQMNEFEIGGVSQGIFEHFESFNCSAGNTNLTSGKIFNISESKL